MHFWALFCTTACSWIQPMDLQALRSGASPTGLYSFQFVDIEGAWERLEVRDADGTVLYTEDRVYRDRDRNLAAWVDAQVLFASSGDVGSFTLDASQNFRARPVGAGDCIPKALAEAIDPHSLAVCQARTDLHQ